MKQQLASSQDKWNHKKQAAWAACFFSVFFCMEEDGGGVFMVVVSWGLADIWTFLADISNITADIFTFLADIISGRRITAFFKRFKIKKDLLCCLFC